MLRVVDPLNDIDKFALFYQRYPREPPGAGLAPYYTRDSIEGQPELHHWTSPTGWPETLTNLHYRRHHVGQPQHNTGIQIVKRAKVDRCCRDTTNNKVGKWQDNDIRHHGIDDAFDRRCVYIHPCTRLTSVMIFRSRVSSNTKPQCPRGTQV